jgi:hypothetical protein
MPGTVKADLHISSKSVLTHETVLASQDNLATISIPAGTVAMDAAGRPLTSVRIAPVPGSAVPTDTSGSTLTFTGIAYDIEPDGATFDPPATLSFTVPEDQWNADTRYSLRSYGAAGGSWEEIPTIVDPSARVVSGRVFHLCIFGLFAAPAAEQATTAPTLMAPAAILQAQAETPSRTPLGVISGMVGLMYASAMAHSSVSLAIVLIALAAIYAFTQRAWLARYRTWIILYLISLTGLLWAIFLSATGGPLWESAWIVLTVIGLNLMVHVLRFDRVDLSARTRRGYMEMGHR